MEAAQIVTKIVIECDESRFSMFFSLPFMVSSSMQNAALLPFRGDELKPFRGDELNGKFYGKLQKLSKSGE